jgi:hypothetical protein
MIETQIDLTEQENKSLQFFASSSGKTLNEFIKEAVIKQLKQFDKDTRRQNLMAAAGIWRDRDDIPDLREMRRSAERLWEKQE